MVDELSHFDADGKAAMVDVTGKQATNRTAVAEGSVTMSAAAFAHIKSGTAAKGDVLGVARIAGIMAAKRTSELIPLCHPLPLTKVSIDFELDEARFTVIARSTAGVTGQTGVEMEALTAVSVAALTIYDMLKAVDRSMVINSVRLIEKTGGKSGTYTAK